MKKFFYIIVLTISSLLFVGCTSSKEGESISYKYEDVKDEIIRFHVIANSDNKEDQELKLKVRDKVIKFIEPKLRNSKSIEESRKLLNKYSKEVKNIAIKVIKENGYDYKVNIELSKENFPEKVYGNIVLPMGEYEAYRILIGNASGQNWWCVMFPPLCFVDVTKGEVAYNETKRQMDTILSKGVEVEEKSTKEDKVEEDNVKELEEKKIINKEVKDKNKKNEVKEDKNKSIKKEDKKNSKSNDSKSKEKEKVEEIKGTKTEKEEEEEEYVLKFKFIEILEGIFS